MTLHPLPAALAALFLGTVAAEAADNSAALDLIRRECSTCHGAQGVSVSPTFPNLAGQTPQYLGAQLRAFRDHSRADPHAQAFMWGMAAQLTDDTIKEMADYFAKQPAPRGASADKGEVAAGEKIYQEGVEKQDVPSCMSCHGDKAQGNELFPRLAGQRRSYLEKQLEAFSTELRANEIMHENAKKLSARQISDIAAYLSSL
ncbi:MAG TPA: c-type cytochrome [Stellaceae bacterium]|nr:c-type cytochrome [Stellaceae bacterium]